MTSNIISSFRSDADTLIRSRSVTFSLALVLALAAPLAATPALAADLASGTTDIASGADNTFNDLHVGPRTGTAGLTIHGAGVQLTVTNGLFIGDQGGNGSIEVYDTGTLVVSSGGVTVAAGGGTGTMKVSGTGSKIEIDSGALLVGDATSSGTLTIDQSATLTSQAATVGTKGTVTVDNAAAWTSNGAIAMKGALTIQNGGAVTSGVGTEILGKASVTGDDSRWTISGTPAGGKDALYIGSIADSSQHGELSIEQGAKVSADSMMIRGSLSGDYSVLAVDGAGSALTLANGMNVTAMSTVAITNGGKVIVNGDTFMGAGSAIFPSSVTVSGAGSEWRIAGGMEYDSGILTIANGGAVTVGGNMTLEGSDTLINIGAAAGQAPVAAGKLNAATIEGDGGRIVLNHTDTDYTFGASISGTANVDVLSGTTTLTGNNSFAGATTVAGGTLRAGSGQAFSPNSAFTVGGGATLDLAGYSQHVASLDNAGTVYLNQGLSQAQSGGAPGTVLTVGDYTSSGGTMVFNTVLGDNTSATDRLVITGTLTNNAVTNVQVVNIGGLGAQTAGDGILLIQTSGVGAGAAQAFQLAPGARVAAGAYEYTLVSGSGANATNLYLSSAYYPMGGGSGAGTASGDKDGRDGSTQPAMPARTGAGVSTVAGVAVLPQNYRVEVPLAGAIAPVATEYGYAMLDTLHERVADVPVISMQPVYQDRVVHDAHGNRATVRENAQGGEPQWFAGAWGRLIGDRGFHKPGSFEQHGPSYDYTFGGIQAGLDIYGREQAGTVDKAGLYFGYGNIDANVRGAYGGKAGDIDSDAFTLGGYWTHKDAQGWYSDAVLQGTWYSTDATSTRGQKLKPDGFGIIASLEGGYSYKIGDGLFVEPQAQLSYQNVSFDSFSDAYGRFALGDSESLRGRLGLRLNKVWNAGEVSKLPFSTWLRANVWHEFMGDPKTTVTNIYGANAFTLPSSLTGTWGEIGAGISGQVSENVSVFGTGAYNHSLDNKGREAWDGRVGLTVKW